MKTTVVALVIAGAVGLGGVMMYTRPAAPAAGAAAGGGRGSARPPMPVEMTPVRRAPLAEQVLVVGNLIGESTVEVVPKVNGRLQTVEVKLGDPVRQGQTIARLEDREIQEQVRQAQASFAVGQATIRQREADLKLAKTNLERSRSLYERQLLPQQTFDDTESRYEAATAQLDLARAQFDQAKARLDELKITLQNTVIVSPVNGYVGKRYSDVGAFTSVNAPVASIVAIGIVRMVANLVERDVRRVTTGTPATVEVDAYPGETFNGRVSRVAPVFDPATRTAEMEIEVPNPGHRLKPGMYARVKLTVETRPNAVTVPRNAVVVLAGRSGVFVPNRGTGPVPASDAPAAMTARFLPVETGISDGERVEIKSGLGETAEVITTGAGALKDGDRIVAAGAEGGRRGAAGASRGSAR